ncbi:hypothetical protein KIH39_16655 [Telmatocola sphagniphila]|uniref:Uncharacterized protein n=1 Tax=Telmatocola sphagniphila TaxID=1123043 RepID=A0A8E6B1T0_9BACT|nr:hypothetical protein [Telmatocola sphagniphila]QVL30480.1 hypothetical protein KIH39_16655 [Telmatocola sphagniphila]
MITASLSPAQSALEALRLGGNPFRNYFARNPDDDVCARYHVPELYSTEREMLFAVVDLYRRDPNTHSEIVPILGNKGAGKTHLLHSIKHGSDSTWQMLVTPGVFQKDADFLEYLLFQIIDTLLSGGEQRGKRPLQYIGEMLTRRLMTLALRDLSPEEKLDLFPPPGLGRWTRRLGLGHSQAQERCQWLMENLSGTSGSRSNLPIDQAIEEAGLTVEHVYEFLGAYLDRTEGHSTSGLMRRAIYRCVVKAFLLKDESELAEFLTYGFAELDFAVRPTRQDLVLALFKTLMEAFRTLKTPVVIAFDQLEDLLLARRTDDAHQIAEAFFAGIVRIMHQIDGLCFLVFAERGLWNRFVPSLDGYIQDRLNNPVHIPRFGTIKALRLEAPSVNLVKRVVEARMKPVLADLPKVEGIHTLFPFTNEQIERIAKTEPTLRDMLQQFRQLFDHLANEGETSRQLAALFDEAPISVVETSSSFEEENPTIKFEEAARELSNRISEMDSTIEGEYVVKSVEVVETPAAVETPVVLNEPVMAPVPLISPRTLTTEMMVELWEQEQRSALRKLEPEGALTGATRELQAGLGTFLRICHEHGVKFGPWRLQHVVTEYTFGDHPTYGCATLAHWACKDSQPWRIGIGLFMARAAGKPKDLEIKLSLMEVEPAIVDHLILLRPEDDLAITGKSKTLWNESEKRGRHARMEPVSVDTFAMLYAFPRWVTALMEALPEGSSLPNLADLIQEYCEKLLEQVCMPVQS